MRFDRLFCLLNACRASLHFNNLCHGNSRLHCCTTDARATSFGFGRHYGCSRSQDAEGKELDWPWMKVTVPRRTKSSWPTWSALFPLPRLQLTGTSSLCLFSVMLSVISFRKPFSFQKPFSSDALP